jgi:hypothetical protein
MRKTFIIDVLSVSNAAQAPQMSAGSPYSFQLIGVGGVPAYTFESDDLPEGLSISASGLISGTPTFGGPVDSIVTISDVNGASCDIEITSENCPVFDSLVWNVPLVVPAAPPPNSSSFTATEDGRNNEINAVATMNVLGQPFVYINSAQCTDFTTDQIDCVVTINVKSQVGGGYGPTPGGHGGWTMQLQVFDNNPPFTTFLNVQSGIDFGPGAAIYNFPITLPSGVQPGVFVGLNVGYGLIDFGPISGAIDVLVTFGS